MALIQGFIHMFLLAAIAIVISTQLGLAPKGPGVNEAEPVLPQAPGIMTIGQHKALV